MNFEFPKASQDLRNLSTQFPHLLHCSLKSPVWSQEFSTCPCEAPSIRCCVLSDQIFNVSLGEDPGREERVWLCSQQLNPAKPALQAWGTEVASLWARGAGSV